VKIAAEGFPFVAIGLGVLVIAGFFGLRTGGWFWAPFVLWLPIAVWIPLFFRDPQRLGDRGDHLAISPADGKIVVVDTVDMPDFIEGKAIQISVFMNVFNVHVNRYPVNGTVRYRQYEPGKFFNATLDKASEQNERMSLGIESPRGRVLVRQIAGLVARRIVTDHHVDETVSQGERLGLIRFGSRVDTFLPLDAQPKVSVGEKVHAGVTVLAEWDR